MGPIHFECACYSFVYDHNVSKIICRPGLKYNGVSEGKMFNLSAGGSSLLVVVELVPHKSTRDVWKLVLQKPDVVLFFLDSVCRGVRTTLVSGKPWSRLRNKPLNLSWWCFSLFEQHSAITQISQPSRFFSPVFFNDKYQVFKAFVNQAFTNISYTSALEEQMQ